MADHKVLTLNEGTPQIVANASGDNYKFPNLITVDPVTADVMWENNGVLNINGGAPSVDPNYVGENIAPNPSASGVDSLAMGPTANASAINAIAIGSGSIASDIGNIAIGLNADVSNPDSIAIGTDALTTQRDSVALGIRATADREAVAIGSDALADGRGAIAVGEDTNSTNNDAITVGRGSTATGLTSIAIGRNADSLSNQSTAIGGSSLARFRATAMGNNSSAEGQRAIGLGFLANATSNDGMAFGNESLAENIGEITYATGNLGDPGDVKYSTYICRGSTNNANALIINPDGGTTNRMILLPETFWGFEIDLIAFQTSMAFDGKKVKYEGAIKRDASSNTSLVGSVTTTTIAEDAGASAWVAAITANDTDEALQIEVTGEAAHMINWVAVVRIVGTRDV